MMFGLSFSTLASLGSCAVILQSSRNVGRIDSKAQDACELVNQKIFTGPDDVLEITTAMRRTRTMRSVMCI